MIRSYLMGVADVGSELEKLGFQYEKNGRSFGVILRPEQVKEYREFVKKVLKPGLWNEWTDGENVWFTFKALDGKIIEIDTKNSSEVDILQLCNECAKANFKSVAEMMNGNEFYRKEVK